MNRLGKIFIGIMSLIFIFPLSSKAITQEEGKLIKNASTLGKDLDSMIEEVRKLAAQQREYEEHPTIDKRVITPSEISTVLLPPQVRNKRMDLEFTQGNLEDVLRTIGEVGGINIMLDPELKETKVDIHLRDVPIEEALGLLYNSYNLGSYQVGRSLYISTRDKIKEETKVKRVIKLQNVNVEEAKELLKDLVEVVNVSKETNTLIIQADPETAAQMENILKKVDIPQPQVILEAKIITIDKAGERELGIDWSDSIPVNFQESLRPQSFDDATSAIGSPFRIYKITRNALQFESAIKLLESKNHARVLSTPSITTINNKKAEIFIGDEIPYTINTVTGGVASTQVRFTEAGVKLGITPIIIEDDFVVIKVEPEVSNIIAWRGANDEYPQVRRRQAIAYVRVKNRQPFIMGGLLDKTVKKNVYKVPFLGELPLFGGLFRYEKDETQDTEIIISVTPNIISGNM